MTESFPFWKESRYQVMLGGPTLGGTVGNGIGWVCEGDCDVGGCEGNNWVHPQTHTIRIKPPIMNPDSGYLICSNIGLSYLTLMVTRK